jgi:hypothetical protein
MQYQPPFGLQLLDYFRHVHTLPRGLGGAFQI